MNIKKITDNVSSSAPLTGVELYSAPTSLQDVTVITGSILGGDTFSPAQNPAIAGLTAIMLDKGAKGRQKRAIIEELESLGANIEFSYDAMRVRFSAICLKKDIAVVIRILAEELRTPAFQEKEFANEKALIIGSLQTEKEDTRIQATKRFLQTIYPRSHANYDFATNDEIKFVRKTDRADLINFHKQSYGLGNMKIVATGDIDTDALSKAIKKEFSNWQDSSLSIVCPREKARAVGNRDNIVNIIIPDKECSDVCVGAGLGISESHEDYYPLVLGFRALGNLGLISRLFCEVREKKGLTYRINAGLDGALNSADGYWWIKAIFAPDLLKKGLDAIEEELVKFAKTGISEKEFTILQTEIPGSFTVGLSSARGLSKALLNNAEQGKPLAFIDEFVPMITSIARKQVNDAILRYIIPDNATWVSAGAI